MKASCNTIIFIICIIYIVIPTLSTFTVDINQTTIETNRQWSRIKLKYVNGTQPYQTYYDSYPKGWNQVIDYIYIPVDQLKNNRKFPCKIRVKDNTGQQIKFTIVYFTSSSKIFISDSLFGYEQQFDNIFFETGIFGGKPQFITNSNNIISQGDLNNTGNFIAQQNVVDKISSISKASGAGLIDMIDALGNQNKTVVLANAEAAMKLKNQVINTNSIQIKSNLNTSISLSSSSSNGIDSTATSTSSSTTSTSTSSSPTIVPINQITTIAQAAIASQAPKAQIVNQAPMSLTQDQKQLILIDNIKKNQISQTSLQRSIQNIFFRLPGPQQLDSIIITGDAFALIKTIQKVIASDLSCQQKMSYLSDFFGRIQSAINIKAFTATQLTVIIEGAQNQINSLNNQIKLDKQSISKLGLVDLRNKLNQTLINLQTSYNKFNIIDRQIQNKKILLFGYTKNLQQIKRKSDLNRQQIPTQQLQLNQIILTIDQLNKQYQLALSKRTSIQTNIQKLSTSVISYDTKIQQNQNKIDLSISQITKIQDKKQQIKTKYQILQISIQKQRTIITQKQKIQAQYKALIQNLQKSSDIQKQKMNNNQINKLKDLITNLQYISINITQQVDDVNYRCNQVKQIQSIKNNNNNTNNSYTYTYTYNIAPKQYNNYIQTCYQIKPDPINLKSNKITINPINILDNNWISKYGNPYPISSYTQTKQFSFNQDFNCNIGIGNGKQIQSNSGIIKNINKKYIEIDNFGKIHKLNLGACSRIDTVNNGIQAGQKIYFRGKKINKNQYNLHKGSCV